MHECIGLFLAHGQHRRALEMLDKGVEAPLLWLQAEAWVIEERLLAWLYRMVLLRELGRLTEALAWEWLEVEMNGVNPAAVALRERLKKEEGFQSHSWLFGGWRECDLRKPSRLHPAPQPAGQDG